MGRKFLIAFLTVLVSGLATASPAAVARPAPVQASIAPEATLVDGGAAVVVVVTVTCAGGSDVLEAFVYVTQDELQSPFAAIPVRCGGPGRTYTVWVPAPSGTVFHTGSARASGYVLVDKQGTVTSTSPGTELTVV